MVSKYALTSYVEAQLIGKKARECAAALDGGGGGRVVVGLCGVLAQDRPAGGGATAAVWDPKEESTLVVHPDHPMALKL